MKRLSWIVLTIFMAACAHKEILQYEHPEVLKKVEEYDKKMEVKELPVAESSAPSAAESEPIEAPAPKKIEKKKKKKKKSKKMEVDSSVHQPDIEDSEGFVGRRPVAEPFRVGEKIVLSLSYFNIVAGTLTIEVKPFVEVNGEKAYHFEANAKSNSFFSRIYAVDDTAVTYVSYNDWIPFNLAITLKESKQLAEARTLFDWEGLMAHYWKKRVTKEHGEEESKVDWAIKPFSQNVISAAFYLRTFSFKVGKTLAMRVVDEGKNIVFTGEVIRKEVLETEAGKFRTIVIRPKLEVDGVFAPVGEILIWLTDDDRKFMVRAESKIRIGALVAKVKEIIPGGDGKMPVQTPE